jgi:tetratricopeptide (TPR) repeat protein
MDWLSTTPVLLATSLFVLQGCSFLLRRDRAAHAGCCGQLAILLASLGLTTFFLLGSGSLILSPEYAVVMAQGRAASIGLAALIVGFSIAAGLGLHVARCVKLRPSHPVPLLVLAIAFGLLSALRIHALNPADPPALRVHSYDFWWPPLLIWISICITEAALTTIRVAGTTVRAWGAVSLCLIISLEAVHRGKLDLQYADPRSLFLWYCLLVTLPFSPALGTWIFLKKLGPVRLRSLRWLNITLSIVAGTAGLLSGLFWIFQDHLFWAFRPWFLCVAWLALIGLLALAGLFRQWRAGVVQLPELRGLALIYDCVALLALVALLGGLIDLFHFGWLEPIWDLTGLILVLVVLVEVLGGGPLRLLAGHRWMQEILAAEAPLLALATTLGKGLRTLLTKAAGGARNVFKADSTATLTLKIVVVVAILVAASEIPNSGKTIVQPFTTLGFSDKDENNKDLGLLISGRIVNTLGLLRQELRPSMITLSSPGKDKEKSEVRILDTGQDTGSLQAAVKSSDFEIPGTKINIPLSWFTDLIQSPMRGLLSVRVVRGSVSLRQGGGLSLLVSSTTGETWRAPQQFPSSTSPGEPSGSPSPLASNGSNGRAPPVSTEIGTLGDELAYKLVSSDVTLVKAGMTTSWQAIPPFRQGLVAWDAFNTSKDYAYLQTAISMFQEAIKIDQKFPWAHYYLGMALREDGQPGAAVLAFRHSLQASPGFYRAQLALADTLYFFESYYLEPPAELSDQSRLDKERVSEAHKARVNEAKEWRQRLIRFPPPQMPKSDLAAAYAGLARDALDSRDDGPPSLLRLARYYLTYFYAKRAEHLYAGLARAYRSDSDVNAAEGDVLDELGVLLEDTQRKSYKEPPDLSASAAAQASVWHCSALTVFREGVTPEGRIQQRYLSRSPYTQSALKYYQFALTLQLEDPVMRCNAASAAVSLGNPRPMQELEMDDHAHLQTARDLIENAKGEDMATFYRLALQELDRAIELAPDNGDALNEYAYTFWRWRLRAWNQKPPVGPEPQVAHRAEKYARDAVHLAAGKSDPTTEATVRSTLGEVLLGQARAHEAVEELQKINLVRHAVYNEMRWDAALANLCASIDDWESHRISSNEYQAGVSKAAALLEDIGTIESARETQPFTSGDHELEAARPNNVCRWNSQQPGWQTGVKDPGPRGTAVERVPDHPRYQLRGGKPAYSSYTPCAWEGVIPLVEDASDPDANPLQLHVWGGGIDRRIVVPKKSEQRDDIFLTGAPRATHHYYFAQLEDTDTVPVSYVYPIETFANASDGRCSKNFINLIFVPTHE